MFCFGASGVLSRLTMATALQQYVGLACAHVLLVNPCEMPPSGIQSTTNK